MTDPVTVGATVIQGLKALAEVSKNRKDTEILQSVVSLHGDVIELIQQNDSLRARVKELERGLEIQGQIVFDNDVYYLQQGDTRDGPYCTRCWDVSEKLVRMLRKGNPNYRDCPECKNAVKLVRDRDEPGSFRIKPHL